jgi:hypothetical protein
MDHLSGGSILQACPESDAAGLLRRPRGSHRVYAVLPYRAAAASAGSTRQMRTTFAQNAGSFPRSPQIRRSLG